VVFAIAAGARSAYQLATRFDEAPVAYSLSALAAAVYVIAAAALRTDRRGLLAGAASLELAGVLAVGTLTIADPGAFPDETVWSRFGEGYGFLPLVLPAAALGWLGFGVRGGGWGGRRGGGEPDSIASTFGSERASASASGFGSSVRSDASPSLSDASARANARAPERVRARVRRRRSSSAS
jgi:hypothetical protein